MVVGILLEEIREKIGRIDFGSETVRNVERGKLRAADVEDSLTRFYGKVTDDSRHFHVPPVVAGLEKQAKRMPEVLPIKRTESNPIGKPVHFPERDRGGLVLTSFQGDLLDSL